MSTRREIMNYIGMGIIAVVIGYYTIARELLGIQSQKDAQNSNLTPPDGDAQNSNLTPPNGAGDCPSMLSVSPADDARTKINQTDRELIQYQELSNSHKKEFKKAVENGTIEEFDRSMWSSRPFVQYQETNYKTGIVVC